MVEAWQPLQAPETALNYANTQQQNNDTSQLQNIKAQADTSDLQAKQRSMQLSMLSGVLSEPDPNKQRALLNNIVPIANKINPSYQIDPNIDVPTVRALVQSQYPLTNIPQNTSQFNGLSPIVKAGLQSGQLGYKDVLTAQAANPFLDVGGATSGGNTGTVPGTTIPLSPTTEPSAVPASGAATEAATKITPAIYQPPADVANRIQQLPTAMQPTVSAIIEGRELPPSLNSRNPGAQSIMQAVNFADPSFDFSNAQNRAKARASFTSGADANNITALNTAIPHIVALNNAFQGLNNGGNETVNQASNWLTRQYDSTSPLNNILPSTQGAQAKVSTDATAVAHELAKVFRSTGMSEAEIQDWQSKINATKTPEEQKAVIGSALDLMDGRLQALGDKYSQGMGVAKNGIDLLSPASQKAFQALREGTPQPLPQNASTQAQGMLKQSPAQSQPAPNQSTPVVTTKEAFDKLPSGTIYVEVGDDGKPQKYRKP